MTERRFRHVYILGAGFSYAMGGPLFTELLTPTMAMRCANLDLSGSATLKPPMRQMFEDCGNIFQSLSRDSERQVDRGSYPRMNVEQFLERCDAAAAGKQPLFARNTLGGNFACLQSIRDTSSDESEGYAIHMAHFVRMLKLKLAIETSAFLHEHIDQSERWEPYVDWFKQLSSKDVIITTNYDRLIEEVAKRCGRGYPEAEEPVSIIDHFGKLRRHPVNPVLCKLHGSVDWFLEDGKAFVQPRGARFPDWDKEVLLGVPGSSKIALEEGVLRDVWNYAFEAIKDADFVSIVGYSMPETDNRLRNRLLDSIAANRDKLCEINIVMGSRSEKGERAEMILRQAVRNRGADFSPLGFPIQVNLLPIYAQDYLARFVPRTEDEYRKKQFVEH